MANQPSGGDAEDLARAIAANVRRARTEAGWSLDELAARSGASKGVVVGVEQGRANPSIGTLLKIADGLGVPLTRLLERPPSARVRIVAPEDAVTLAVGPGGSGTLLASTEWIGASHAELWSWALEPSRSHESDAHRAGTRELVHVRRGSLRLTVGGEQHDLPEGTTAVFAADAPHAYANAGRGRLELDMIVLEPSAPEPVAGAASPTRSRRPRRSDANASDSRGSPRTGARGRSRASRPA